ncbi:type ISP restriction/modification enzyme [Bacteroides reticulotermitis]|uniref:Type ISP restriction-modification enzyme LLaBIII C-terminal specificity domain-containing protein n=2 Tax=Bacteroides reticulotermitis TaxID=1133319 RepID=W4UWK8_9BACE|nr:type ISP restriction/modification enzyme [Bacteroides reticulotermitis]MBB4045827.1 putative helicase [Bacteroides reticulotermitis]GAE84968.1 hypothetical protein JCM10512_3354 [Bacteroides reticulotermitis JCM 10512]
MTSFQDTLTQFRRESATEREKGTRFERLMQAYGYVVNGRSAIEWIMECYQIKTHKENGIVNNPNDWAREHNKPRYILDLLLSIITVSVRTVKIVKGLPKVDL